MKQITFNEANYDLTVYNIDTFKTSMIDFVFNVPNTDDDITNIYFLKNLLLLSSKNYPTFKSISIELEKLYNAGLNVSISKKANAINLTISLSVINDCYTENGNCSRAIKFLFDLINNPNFTNGRLDKKIFDMIITSLNNNLLRLDENPNIIAAYNFINHIDPNSFFAVKLIGDSKRISSLTRESVAKYYVDFFKRASVKIFAVGDFEPDALNDIIKLNNQFAINPFTKAEIMPLNISKDIPKKIIEEDDFEQSILLSYLTINDITPFESLTVGAVFNKIFGQGSLTDKLSHHLREENSLCYSVQCDLYYYLQSYVISSGISKKDCNKAISLIKQSLKEMQDGSFSDDDIKQAKKSICFSHDMIYDSIFSICNLLENEPVHNQPDQQLIISAIKKVTKADIMNYAKKIKIVTNYLLAEGKNAKERD